MDWSSTSSAIPRLRLESGPVWSGSGDSVLNNNVLNNNKSRGLGVFNSVLNKSMLNRVLDKSRGLGV